MLNWIKRLIGTAPPPEIPLADWLAVEARLPLLNHLSSPEREKLRALALQFILSKAWHGAQGLEITLPMQLEIALQACLLILHRDLREYSGWVEIIVYPGDFVIPREVMDEDGVVHEYDDHVLGEAWEGGPLLLSWFDDASDAGGANIVIHEFAHKLDMVNDFVDGAPQLPDEAARRAWQAAFGPAYENFCQRVDAGIDTVIDPYAAESPAEFFAVLSEVFFEEPTLLAAEYPTVFRVLQDFYRQTPH